MSDHVGKTHNGSDKGAAPSNHSYQSVWISHWMRPSCSTAPPTKDHLPYPSRNKEDGLETEKHHLISSMETRRSSKGFKQLGGQTSEIMNGSPTNTKNLKNSFPKVPLCPNNESSSMSKYDQGVGHFQSSRSLIDHNFKNGSTVPLAVAPPTESSSKKQHVQSLNNSARQVKSHIFLGDKDFAESRPLQDDFTGLTSHIVPYRFDHGENKFDGGRTTGPSFIQKQEERKLSSSIVEPKENLSNTNLAMVEHEHRNYGSHSAFLVYEKKMDIHTGKSLSLDLEQNNKSPILNVPSTSDNISPMFVGERCQWMQNCSSMKLFPSQSCPQETTKLDKLHYGCHSLQKMPHFVDVETMRICTAADSMKGLPGCHPRFSQTIHSLLITKNTDVNTCKENQILRESRLSAHFKGTKLSEFDRFSSFIVPGSQGSGFQPLEITKDGGGNENVKVACAPELVSKNESSAETDTMDMNAFSKKNEFAAVAYSSSSIKDVIEDLDVQFQSSNPSTGKPVECREPVTDIPDINLELPAQPVPASSTDDAEPSCSRTQSLDMEQLHSHAEQPSSSNFNHSSDGPLGAEPSMRWIKRLKLTASDSFSLGTKSSNLGDSSSHEKVNNFFSKMMKGNMSGSKQTFGGQYGKELMAPDPTVASLRIGESSSIDTTKGRDIILSHPWIQRWCHKAASSQENPEGPVICEPQCSKVELESFQKKVYPSIAAMALMGKAMRGFQPCEIQKRGSFAVWNASKGF